MTILSLFRNKPKDNSPAPLTPAQLAHPSAAFVVDPPTPPVRKPLKRAGSSQTSSLPVLPFKAPEPSPDLLKLRVLIDNPTSDPFVVSCSASTTLTELRAKIIEGELGSVKEEKRKLRERGRAGKELMGLTADHIQIYRVSSAYRTLFPSIDTDIHAIVFYPLERVFCDSIYDEGADEYLLISHAPDCSDKVR